MYRRFCVLCGKEDLELINGLCKKCYRKIVNSSKEKLGIKLKLCTVCGRLQYKNKWYNKNELLQRLERDLDLEIDDIVIKRSKIDIVGNREVDIELEKVVCKQCIRYLDNSYQYIIQIRGDLSKSEELIGKLAGMNVIIKQINESEYGYDIYLNMSYTIFKKFLSLLKSKKYDILITRKLITYDKQRGRSKYRVTIRVKI